MIKCHCGYIPKNSELYSMAQRFSIYNDTYELECPKCKKNFTVSYSGYYGQMGKKDIVRIDKKWV